MTTLDLRDRPIDVLAVVVLLGATLVGVDIDAPIQGALTGVLLAALVIAHTRYPF